MKLKTIVVNCLFGAALFSVVYLWQSFSGWSPWNILFGPNVSIQEADKRALFITEVVPKKYPLLVSHLKNHGPETVQWTTQVGNQQEQVFTWTVDGVRAETSFEARTENGELQRGRITMLDYNQDGRLDRATYTNMTGQILHSAQDPNDDMSLFMWESGLAMAFKLGSCCR